MASTYLCAACLRPLAMRFTVAAVAAAIGPSAFLPRWLMFQSLLFRFSPSFLQYSMKLLAFHLPDEIPLEDYEALLNVLDASERPRVQRFRIPEDRLRSLIARIAVYYYLITQGVLTKGNKPRFRSGHRGKPYLVSPELNLGFNVSHEGKWVLLGVGEGEVGVDVMDPPPDPEVIKEALIPQMTVAERQALAIPLTPQQLRWTLTTLWTLKEGFTKAVGEGVGFGLERINVVFDGLEVVRVEVDGRDIADDGWKWRIGRVGEGMQAGYAVYWKETEWTGVKIVGWTQLVSAFDSL